MLAYEPGPCLDSVDFELHALEALFHYPAGVVGDAAAGVGNYLGLCVLDHDHAVAVVDVGDCVSVFGKAVEEQFLAAEILCERLVVVKMVVGQVGEDSDLEFEAGDSVLLH